MSTPIRAWRAALAALTLAAALTVAPLPARTPLSRPALAQVTATPDNGAGRGEGTSLEQAAERAGDTGRTVALSLLGLALAIAAVILVFKRDFKEAAAIFGVGLLGVLLATPAGLNALNDLVGSLFGAR